MATQKYLTHRIHLPDSHKLETVRAEGAYKTLERALKELKPAEIIDKVKASGLRGRGGAGFPTGLKWTFMPPLDDPRIKYLAVNSDESEPGTCKDRILLLHDPHLLIEGIALASYAMGVRAAYIYMRYEYREPFRVLQGAVDEAYAAGFLGEDILGSGFDLDVYLHPGAGAYICGEETALMESLEGKRGHPRPKPPFPAGAGLWGKPTTVNNVETLSNVVAIVEKGPEWYRTIGTEKSPGNFLCGVSGQVEKPGVYELPLGITVREVIEDHAGGVWKGKKLKGFYPGGSSTGILPAAKVDTRMDYDEMMKAGAMLGTGGLIVLDEDADVVEATEVLARFYDHETCGQCSQCRIGTEWLHQMVKRIGRGEGRPEDLATWEDLVANMSGMKTICAFCDGAAQPMRTALLNFREDFEAAIRKAAVASVAPTPGTSTSPAAASGGPVDSHAGTVESQAGTTVHE